MIIGITGQIGAGKSAVAEIFASLGATVVDADQIGKLVVENSPAVLKKLVRKFGDSILTPGGKLRRGRLAELAFASDETRDELNRIVHPPLLKELRSQVKAVLKQSQIIVIDAALLFDWDLDAEVEYTLVVHASKSIRLSRLEARGISRPDALSRMRRQLPFSEYRRRADRVILNSGSQSDLRRKIENLFTILAGSG